MAVKSTVEFCVDSVDQSGLTVFTLALALEFPILVMHELESGHRPLGSTFLLTIYD